MPSNKLITRELLDEPEESPLVFVGNPTSLRGSLQLVNRGEKRISLRRAQLGVTPQHAKAKGKAKGKAKDPEPRVMSMSSIPRVVLQPGQRQRIEVGLSLEPHTPPGEYQAVLDMGDRQQPVVFHVTEHVQLSVSPPQLVVENHTGSTITKRIVLTNEGNVPLTFSGVGAVPLDRENLECFAIRRAISFPEEFESFDRYAVEILRQAQQIMDSTGVLRVRSLQGEIVIQPGEVQPIDLEIQVPTGLNKRSRYRGKVAIYTDDLEFVVVPAQSGLDDDVSSDNEPDVEESDTEETKNTNPKRGKK